MMENDVLSIEERHILDKINRTRPEVGEDNSKERYRYMQWISCKNAVLEAMRENRQLKGD